MGAEGLKNVPTSNNCSNSKQHYYANVYDEIPENPDISISFVFWFFRDFSPPSSIVNF
jgi:hypothetical protein